MYDLGETVTCLTPYTATLFAASARECIFKAPLPSPTDRRLSEKAEMLCFFSVTAFNDMVEL